MKLVITTCLYLFLYTVSISQSNLSDPSFEEILSLQNVGSPAISPDGNHVAYTVSKADWGENRWDNEIWLSKNGDAAFQLTNTIKGSSSQIRWSPDGEWIAFTANRGDKNQIHVININGGEAKTITHEKDGIQGFDWMPDGSSFIFTKTQTKSKLQTTRSDRYGAYSIDDDEYKLSWLYQIEFNPNAPSPNDLPCYDKDSTEVQTWPCIEWPKAEALIDSVDFTVRNFDISPDGKSIAFTHSPTPLINSFFNADISVLDLEDKSIRGLVENPSADNLISWSPDGQSILYDSDLENRTSNYYQNNRLFIIPKNGGNSREIINEFDENLSITWVPTGMFGFAAQKTERHLFKINPSDGSISLMSKNPSQIFGGTFSKDGSKMAFRAKNGNDLMEIYTSSTSSFRPNKLTNQSDQINKWKTAQSEVVQWKSKDGANIEGVLHKPIDYDPSIKYPLLVVIHGGPTGVDRKDAVFSYVYPINQWLNKGALVLRVNYRGSAGYGAAFRALNVRNLGVGDAWDVLSGVNYLADQGLIDEDRMGCMGWSQGGYISAFLTTHTDRFKAISVGAGISNWMTYYVNTDIHPFTVQYLKANPWEDEEIYRKTSPMTNILNAKTPTLIQHGEFDNRVPLPNAFELAQGLRDMGVDNKLIVYKGFGHGITKPKERLAAIWHNWAWFNKYVWGEEVKLPEGLDQ